MFSKKGSTKNKENSYLESYHPGTFEKMKDENFCEIGRTFVMPDYQNKEVLKRVNQRICKNP